MKLWLAALAALLVCCPMSYASSRGQRARGAAVFASSGCAHCHSIRHNGGNKGPDLSGVGRRLNEAQMRRQIADGSKVMPPFGDVLQPSDFDDLISYLRSCKDKQKKQ